MYMKELTIQDIETIVHRDENRVMEAKETTGELVKGMQSGCAFLNTDGGWLFFGIHPTKLTILGQDVADRTRQEIAWEMRKFAPTIDLAAQYIDVPDRPGKQVIAIWFPAPVIYTPPYTYDGRPFRGLGTGTCPNLKNQRFAYLFPHPVLSWEGLYQRSGNGQFRSFMY